MASADDNYQSEETWLDDSKLAFEKYRIPQFGDDADDILSLLNDDIFDRDAYNDTMNVSLVVSSPDWWFNRTAVDMGDRLQATLFLGSAIPMTIVYGLIFVTGIFGNVCTCIIIARNKHMHNATNYYLFSLAISDLLLLVLGLPQEICEIWHPSPYIFSESYCVFRGLAAEASANASILTITAFTVERYVAICYPLKAHTMSKLSRAVKLILIIWVIATSCAVPQAIQFGFVYLEYNGTVIPESVLCLVKNRVPHAFELSTFLFFCFPMTLISVLYMLIAFRLRRSSLNVDRTEMDDGESKLCRSPRCCRQQNGGSGGGGAASGSGSAGSRRAVIKMLGSPEMLALLPVF